MTTISRLEDIDSLLKHFEKVLADSEKRVKHLEEFHYRVKLGQRWFICGLASLGGIIAFVSYAMNILAHWTIVGVK